MDRASVQSSHSPPTPHSHFTVKSGSLCYGALHNILNEAESPRLSESPCVAPALSGTVMVHELNHNVPAQKGTWATFGLVDVSRDSDEMCAWFSCHTAVDPEKEVDKILRGSGSPYEPDHGSSMNDEETAASNVLVINRYDWLSYDRRHQDLFPNATLAVGLVDYDDAKDVVRRWKDEPEAQRTSSTTAAWMYIPRGEYLFGRFGFDDNKTAARSFLVFTMDTNFARTAFLGLTRTLRAEETEEERFQRMLREEHDFTGVKSLRQLCVPGSMSPPPPPPPPTHELNGPYDRSEYLLGSLEFHELRTWTRSKEVAAPLVEQVLDLVNQLVLSYLDRFTVPHCSCRSMDEATTAFFPGVSHRTSQQKLEYHLFKHFKGSGDDKTPGSSYDTAAVASRIRSFLSSRCGDDTSRMALDADCISGLNRVIVYFLSQVFELVANRSYHSCLVPSDFRMALVTSDLNPLFEHSHVFWEGGPSEMATIQNGRRVN